ncbi:MAG: glycosyltransferase family 2 protein, partial [bacterium]|nr:glycosyltransferase family 2 protein [bacterium]
FGVRYTDLGPFRAIQSSTLEKLDMQDTTFGWTVEMQVKAAKQGVATEEVPVRYRKRIGVSKITGTVKGTVKAGWKILYTIFKYRWA